MYFKEQRSLLASRLLSNDIVPSLSSNTGPSNNSETKSESMSDVLSDWSSEGFVLADVTTDYMRPKRSCDFSFTVSTFSLNLQSPYWHFWHHLLEILNSSQLSSLHKNSGPRCSTGYISVLNKRHRCQNCAAGGGGDVVLWRVLVKQTIRGDNFERWVTNIGTKTAALWSPPLSGDPLYPTQQSLS